MYNCPKCKQTREAKKKLEIYRLPKVLIIHLKRFKETKIYHTRRRPQTPQMQKDGALIQFPLDKIDMREHIPSAI